MISKPRPFFPLCCRLSQNAKIRTRPMINIHVSTTSFEYPIVLYLENVPGVSQHLGEKWKMTFFCQKQILHVLRICLGFRGVLYINPNFRESLQNEGRERELDIDIEIRHIDVELLEKLWVRFTPFFAPNKKGKNRGEKNTSWKYEEARHLQQKWAAENYDTYEQHEQQKTEKMPGIDLDKGGTWFSHICCVLV